VALAITEVSEERIASIIRVTIIDKLGARSAVTNNRNTLQGNTSRRSVPPKRRFLQDPHGYFPEDGILHSHRLENLKYYRIFESDKAEANIQSV
jgi:hypothetical protein